MTVDKPQTSPSQTRYAGFGVRLIAYIMDAIVLTVLLIPLRVVLPIEDSNIQYGRYLLHSAVCGIIVGLFLSSSWQATPGKKAFNIYVAKVIPGGFKRLNLVTGFSRYMAYFIYGEIILQVYLYFYGAEYAAYVAYTKQAKQNHSDFLNGMSQFTKPAIIYCAAVIIPGMLWYLPIVFTKQKTALHDIIFKTRVLRGQKQ